MVFGIFIKGFVLGASLIIAIGLQNALILRQGLKNRHVFASALTASLCDAVLIGLGVLGFGAIVESYPSIITIITLAGAAFLFFYGVKSFLSAFRSHHLDQADAAGSFKNNTVKNSVLVVLGVSLLNPHVYLDTVILLGGLSSAYLPPGHIIFGLGAMVASFAWFFMLAYGARFLAPVFEKPQAWKTLDILIGMVMWLIAASLVF